MSLIYFLPYTQFHPIFFCLFLNTRKWRWKTEWKRGPCRIWAGQPPSDNPIEQIPCPYRIESEYGYKWPCSRGLVNSKLPYSPKGKLYIADIPKLSLNNKYLSSSIESLKLVSSDFRQYQNNFCPFNLMAFFYVIKSTILQDRDNNQK
jgi:hypothetical protein